MNAEPPIRAFRQAKDGSWYLVDRCCYAHQSVHNTETGEDWHIFSFNRKPEACACFGGARTPPACG